MIRATYLWPRACAAHSRAAARISKRGMRENEKVLGRFAQLRVADMDEQQLQQFEKLLDQFDPDMNKWLLRKEPIPKELASPVWDDILKFIDEGPAGFETGHN